MKLTLPSRPIHFFLFYLLAFLCYQGHQWTRHLTGAALCGGFGSMTFTVATPRQPCALPALLTLSGPVFTYSLAWLGMLLLRSRKSTLFAYALIFASFSHLRWIQTLTGRGDELILAQEWFGVASRLAVAAAVFLIGLPPVIAAYRALANRRRWLAFLISWLLPLPLLFVLLVGDKLIFGAGVGGPQPGSFLSVPWIVWVTDMLAAVLLAVLLPPHLSNG